MLAKKVLSTAILAAMSSGAFAMEAMQDEALSDTTGQSGITITTVLPSAGITGTLVYTDTDGYTGSTASGDLIAGFKLSGDPITLKIDAGSKSTSPFASNLLIDLSTGSSSGLVTTITGLQTCATSQDTAGTCAGGGGYIAALPVGGVSIALKNMDMQILLGYGTTATSTSHFITATLPSTFNLTIGTGGTTPQFSLLDPNNNVSNSNTPATAGGIGFSQLSVTPTGAMTTTIDACTTTATATCTNALTGGLAGLLIQTSATVNVSMTAVTLGNVGSTSPTASIGNVGLYGLNLNGTSIMVAGH